MHIPDFKHAAWFYFVARLGSFDRKKISVVMVSVSADTKNTGSKPGVF